MPGPGGPENPYGAPQGPGGPPVYGPPGPTGAPGAWYGPPPAKDNTLKWVLIIVGVLLLLTCGGCLAVVGLAANETKTIVDRELSRIETSESVEVVEGEAFTIGNLDVSQGWRTQSSDVGEGILNLVATPRQRDDPALLDSVPQIDFSFYRRDRLLGTVSCFGFDAKPGEPTVLECDGSVERIRRADRITAETLLS